MRERTMAAGLPGKAMFQQGLKVVMWRPHPYPGHGVPPRTLRKSQAQECDTVSQEGACPLGLGDSHLDALEEPDPGAGVCGC